MFKMFWVWNDDDFNELNNEINTSYISEKEVWQLALDIIENEYEILIISPIAWIDLDDIDLSLNKSVLTIKWTRKKPEDIYTNDSTLRNSECFWWNFVRNVILPENLDFDDIKASMENNLLVISIKKLNFKSQSIKIDRIES